MMISVSYLNTTCSFRAS